MRTATFPVVTRRTLALSSNPNEATTSARVPYGSVVLASVMRTETYHKPRESTLQRSTKATHDKEQLVVQISKIIGSIRDGGQLNQCAAVGVCCIARVSLCPARQYARNSLVFTPTTLPLLS